MEKLKAEKKRICLLDELRGLAVLCMVLYHAYYIVGNFFEAESATKLFDFFMPVEPFFAGIFISICGISCTFSRSNLNRGLKLLGVAVCFTAVTVLICPRIGIDGLQIYFGILHFLALCILIYALFEKKINRINPFYGILGCSVLYPFFSRIGERVLGYGQLIVLNLPDKLYSTDFLVPLGICSDTFYSADYFPIFPDVFIFFFGVFIAKIYSQKGYPEWTYQKRAPVLAWLGRHSLVIYVLHMPLIFVLAYAVKAIINII